ncbi:MAG: hypothetical protein HY040_23220 [Planctomycetes bacterium]|nr:hypothetical protein [Planctomycetota bacterium]
MSPSSGLFTDGPREVREDSHVQYVLDYQAMRVYGIWIYPDPNRADEAVILETKHDLDEQA